ncbi:MAG: hypothetical protein KA116_11810 [Proteobacteria bacterium]|nr:hypothetical protein [Pseudomonadota bacterium]
MNLGFARNFISLFALGFCAQLFSADGDSNLLGLSYGYASSVYNDSPANYYYYENPEYSFVNLSPYAGGFFFKTQLNYSKQVVNLLNHSTPQYVTAYGSSFGLEYVMSGVALFGVGTNLGLLKTSNGQFKGLSKKNIFEFGYNAGFGLNWQIGETISLRIYNTYTWQRLHSSAFKKRENSISIFLIFAY